ncbi:hypothetical protein DPMN_049248 [Dreissena polymorpha]|uniref:Uncharacterized protein n=1 Tax=Dreissena polymorpha TaxID=45954 RepID=A0A9D4HM17_DREPO|nr:hypothetical protein DPMN_049248 [Dreissena polymorpha]
MDALEWAMLTLSQKIATANQMADFGSDMKDIIGSLKLAKKEVPLSLTGIKFNFEFTFQTQAEMGVRYQSGVCPQT